MQDSTVAHNIVRLLPDLPMAWLLYFIAVIAASLAVITLSVVFIVPELWRAARECWAEWFPPEPVPPPIPDDARRRRHLDALTHITPINGRRLR